MIEQPLAPGDLVDHAKLQRGLDTPICLDESIVSLAHRRSTPTSWARAESSISSSVASADTVRRSDIQAFAQAHGMPVWCGGMLEAGIGRAHNIALSTLAGFTLPGDVSASERYWEEDIIEPPVTVSRAGRSRRQRVMASGSRSTKRASMP